MSHLIPLAEAVQMTSLYRQFREQILKPDYQNLKILPLSEYFSREAFDMLLGQTGCEGVRVYYGMDENKKVHSIFVGVNEMGEDMLGFTQLTNEPEDEIIVERGIRCPDQCPPDSDLNS